MVDLAEETTKLANEIRDSLGAFMLQLSKTHTHRGCIISGVTALCTEVARLRWLAVSTNEVSEKDFDDIFWKAVQKHYKETSRKYHT
jgi:hypothetical protein